MYLNEYTSKRIKSKLLHSVLFMLSISSLWFQAREDVIYMLKSKPTVPEALESRYGSVVPGSALQALQRDGSITGTEPHSHSVYQKPMLEVSQSRHCFC